MRLSNLNKLAYPNIGKLPYSNIGQEGLEMYM